MYTNYFFPVCIYDTDTLENNMIILQSDFVICFSYWEFAKLNIKSKHHRNLCFIFLIHYHVIFVIHNTFISLVVPIWCL